MAENSPSEPALAREFDSLLESIERPGRAFPLLTVEAKELIAFDLGKRYDLARLRSALQSQDGQAMLATLREHAEKRGVVSPSEIVEKPPTRKRTRRKKKRNRQATQPAQDSAPKTMGRKKRKKRTAKKINVTDAQKQLADKLEQMKSRE